eukprot:5999344-Prymnesium_polylepis.2
MEAAFEKGRADGSIFLDPTLNVFAPVAAQQPSFKEYLKFTYQEQAVLSPDGRTRHLLYKDALAELISPQDETNQRASIRAKTVEYLQVQCAAALEKMHDPKLAIADKLTSQHGVNSFGKNAAAHEDTLRCHSTNDALA